MRTTLLFILLISAPVLCFGQKKKPNPQPIAIKKNGRIIGRYDPKSEEFEYFTYLGPSKSVSKRLPRIIEGEINVYKEITSRPMHSPSSPASITEIIKYYVQKASEDRYDFLCGDDMFERKERAVVLASFLQDDPEMQNKVTGEDFALNKENLFKTIKQYNLRKFDRIKHPTGTPTTAIFYVKRAKQPKSPMTLTINDSVKYDIVVNKATVVTLTGGELSKVCLTLDNVTTCDLVRGNQFEIGYFVIRTRSEVEFDAVRSEVANQYLQNPSRFED